MQISNKHSGAHLFRQYMFEKPDFRFSQFTQTKDLKVNPYNTHKQPGFIPVLATVRNMSAQ